MRNKIIYTFISSLILLLMACGTSKQKALISTNTYEPTENVQGVLDVLEKKSLTKRTPDSTLYPSVVRSLLYYGANNKGKEFAEYTENQVEKLSADGYHTLSVQNLKNGNYAHAYKYVSKAVELEPKEYAGYFGWTLLYYYRDYNKALKYLEMCDAFTPNFSDFPSGENIHYLKGLAYMQLNQVDSAYAKINMYIEEERLADAEEFTDVHAFVNRGNLLYKMGRTEEAIQDYKKSISLAPDNMEAIYFLAKAELAIGHNANAKKNLSRALELYEADKRNRDVYIEYFHAVYKSDILELMEIL